jgi:phosphatidylinositol glycan class B
MSKSKAKAPRTPKAPSARQRPDQPITPSGHGRRRISGEHVFLLLLAYRILNALTIKTFFQPDEYYQSLEPAWRLAFGAESGAWITWVLPPYFSVQLDQG